MKYYQMALQKYAVFTGRSRRSEYWFFALFNMIFSVAAMLLDYALHLSMGGIGPVYLLYALAMLIPSLAVSVRRLHDINKSGVFLLVALVPIIGFIWLLVLFLSEGDAGANQYGEDPKIGSISPAAAASDPRVAKGTSANANTAGGYEGGYSGGHNNPGTTQTAPPRSSKSTWQEKPGDSDGYRSGDLYK